MSDKMLTITLTNRAPVQIATAEWPIIAHGDGHDGKIESEANRKWWLRVRRHGNRLIAYGAYESNWENENNRRRGEELTTDEDIPAAIHRVAESLGLEADFAEEVIATLPAERL